jgi:hypothetical protein
MTLYPLCLKSDVLLTCSDDPTSLLSQLVLQPACDIERFGTADERVRIEQWQAALDRAETGIVLDNVGDLREQFGYVPVTHRGHASGFEWFYTTVQEFFDGDPPDSVIGPTSSI